MSIEKKNMLLKALVVAGVLPLCSVDAAEGVAPLADPSAGGQGAETPAFPQPAPGEKDESGFISYSYLGLALDALPAASYCEHSLPGVQAVYVLKNSPAAEAGLRNGDILIALDGQKLFFPNQFSALVRSYKPGTKVEIVLLRGGEKLTKTAVIGERRIAAPKRTSRGDRLAKDDVRIYINGREISLADGSDLGGWISLTPNGILIRDQLDVPTEFRKIVSRAHAKLPDSQRVLTFLRRQYDDARKAALGKTQQTFSQVFFGQGNSVIIVGNEKGRQITVSRADDDEILFRGPCTTQEDIDAIPEEARKIIDSFTNLKPMPLPPPETPEPSDRQPADGAPAAEEEAAAAVPAGEAAAEQ